MPVSFLPKRVSKSMAISIGLHLSVALILGIQWISPPELIQDSLGGMEVGLVNSAQEAASIGEQLQSNQAPVEETLPLKNEDAVTEVQKVPQPIQTQSGAAISRVDTPSLSPAGGQGNSGAGSGPVHMANAEYSTPLNLIYPEAALRRGYEGNVLISVIGGPDGYPVQVVIKKSSGYAVLDQAAIRAVQNARFKPAKIAGIPVQFSVDIPIKFELNN
jgi:TonB family protein